MKVVRFFFLMVSFLSANLLLGQTHFVKKYSSRNGLLSSDNYMTCQDKKGNLWIGSHNGISRFDGKSFTYFTVKDGLPSNDVWYLQEDKEGRMWLGGYYDGAYYIKNNQVYSLPEAANAHALIFSCQDEDTLFFTSMGIKSYRYVNNTFEENSTANGSHYIHVSEKIRLYKPTQPDDKYFGLQMKNKSRIEWYQGLVRYDFFLSRHSQFIKTSGDSIVLIGDTSLTSVHVPDVYKLDVADLRTLNPTGEVFVRTDDKVRVYKNLAQKERDTILENMLSVANLTETAWLLKDHEDNLWATLYRGEIVLVPRQSLFLKKFTNVFNDNNFRSPVLWNKKLYTHSLLGNLYEFNMSANKLIKINANLLDYDAERQKITSLAVSSSQNALVVKRNTILDVLKPDAYNGYIFTKTSQENAHLYLTRGGKLIHSDTFLSCNFNKYSLKNNEAKLEITSGLNEKKLSILKESDSYYLAGGVDGLFVYHKISKSYEKILDVPVQCILPREKDVLVGTNGQGLINIDYTGRKLYNTLDGSSITAIVHHDGIYFLASNKGVIRAVETKGVFNTIGYVTKADGLNSNEINGLAIDSTTLYITSVDGLYTLDYHGLYNLPPLELNVSIDAVYLDDSLKVTQSIFQHNQNNLTLTYKCVAFSNLGEIAFNYRLNNNNWSYTSENSMAYKSLSPGAYTFSIFAIGPDGEHSEVQSYSFTIKEYFTDTWWFKMAVLIALLCIIWFISLSIQRAKTNRLESEKKFADLELRALQSQMNPHFIFNSLNAIQTSMLLQGERQTNKYIAEFSKLMRITLDNSKTGYLSLADELEYLELYLKLEKRRLDGELDYTFEVETDLRDSNIEIPTMIFQPLVENAIVHGLTPKKDNRQLTISFKLEKAFLIGVISDNGIGRKKALQNTKDKAYKSWSSTILKERIEVINRMSHLNIMLHVNDLDEESNSGTVITVKIPLE
jgi:ligand-binding sensor domain-containing protein